MYLSRLEMVGFKSFGLKTELSFNDGVTAIVGPNGCGKTNIVDAIRWVLGEQKTSMLRADSMDHVIFNGSKNRKPLGMAEVSLTIENNKQILPTEYSQVVITRRLFRSGESQYLLNRTACRLKDIIELFMDTGMGANAYSVIELKMVETILSDKADERRHLFEEAAGVTKYKVRRKEAQRKLEGAQKDIARVQDIVREVQKTVNSLARQAEKARQHQEISARLREIDLQVFAAEYAAATAQLADLTEKNSVVVARHTEVEQGLVTLETAALTAEQLQAQTEQNLRDMVDRESEHRATLSQATGNVSVLDERIASTERTMERLEKENTVSTDEQATTNEQLALVRERLTAIQGQVVVAHEALETKRAAAQTCSNAVTASREKLATSRSAMQQVQQQQHELRREQDRVRVQAENMQRRVTDSETGLEQHTTRRHELQNLVSTQEAELPALDQTLASAESALHSGETRQRELRNQQEEQQHKLDELRSTEAHTRASLEFLIGLVDTTESSKFLMNSEEWKPSGEKHTLAEVLNTDDELRVAIEAALGDAARYFVVANRTEANQAIAALSRNNIGKATFLCRDAIPDLSAPPAIQLDGVRGWASELIDTDATLRGAVRGILGRTVVTTTIDAAWQAVATSGVDRAVTLLGEVVHRAGAVRGGSATRTEGVRVGRRERIERMKHALAELEQQVAGGLAFAQKLKDEYATIDLRALGEVVRQATVSRNAVQQKLDGMQVRLADIESSIAKLEGDIVAFRAELGAMGVTHEETSRQLAALDAALTQAAAEMTTSEQQLGKADADLAAASALVRDAEILAVRLDGELTSLQADEARLSNQHLTIDQRKDQRLQELSSLASQLASLKGNLVDAQQQATVLTETLASVSALRQHTEQQLTEHQAAAQQAQEALRLHRKTVDNVVAEHHAIDLQLTSARLSIETLEKHAQEELETEARNVQLGESTVPSEELRSNAQELRRKLTMMGNVNFLALEEHERENERFQFMSTQLADLLESERTLTQTILEINQTARDLFTSTFNQIRQNFTELFKVLFSEDDEADLQMLETEDKDPLECKIEIIAKPRGKRPHSIEMLSGGEKTLTAIALLFSIYLVKPSPFCILDEVDAPLDDANIDRYLKIIRKFSENTQFLMITHNKRTMEAADTLYGVTMEEPAVSKVVSVQLGSDRNSDVRAA